MATSTTTSRITSIRVDIPRRSLAPCSLRSRRSRIKDMLLVALDAIDDLQGYG